MPGVSPLDCTRRVAPVLFIVAGWLWMTMAVAADKPLDLGVAGSPGSQPQGFYSRFIKNRLYVKPGVSYLDFSHLKSGDLGVSGVNFPASLAIQNGRIADAKASVSNQYIPTISIGYFIPHTGQHLSLETVIGRPLDISFVAQSGALRDKSLAPTAELGNLVSGDGAVAGALRNTLNGLGDAVNSATGLLNTGIPPLGRHIGKVKTLPIMLTMLYHPFPDAFVRPYIGGGGIYLYNYDAKITNSVLTEENQPQFDVSSSPGYLLQAGINVGDAHQGFFGFGDVRYIGGAHVTGKLTNVHARVRNPALGGTLKALGYSDDVKVGNADIGLSLNALIYTIGVGYAF